MEAGLSPDPIEHVFRTLVAYFTDAELQRWKGLNEGDLTRHEDGRSPGELFGTNGDSPHSPVVRPHSGTRMVRSLLGQRLGTTT
jgi:hypothetical protein